MGLEFIEEQLEEPEFETYRSSLVAQLRERPKSLGEEFGRHWGEVASRTFSFRYIEEVAACVETCSLKDLQRFSRGRLRDAPTLCTMVRPTGAEVAPGSGP